MASTDRAAQLESARALIREGDLTTADILLRRYVDARADDPAALHLWGEVAYSLGDFAQAVSRYRQAVELEPRNALLRNDLAAALERRGRLAEAAREAEAASNLDPEFPLAAINAMLLQQRQWNPSEAVDWGERAGRLAPGRPDLLSMLGGIYRDLGRNAEGVACLERALDLDPRNLGYRLRRAVVRLPQFFERQAEIAGVRERYREDLQDLLRRVRSASPSRRADAGKYVGSLAPFLLAYQGQNNVELQRLYGAIVGELMREALPQFSDRPLLPAEAPGGRLRVGIVSAWLYASHSNWKIPISGWVENLDRERFELFAYSIESRVPESASVEALFGSRFAHCGGMSIEDAATRIRADLPHVLIYPEIGMHPTATALAALRLAPVQCVSWGHPETSGMNSIDYFLSSDLMEPPSGDDNYTEALVRLPNLSVCYRPPDVRQLARTRSEFGLDPHAVCYFCAQSHYKYLPHHDSVFVQIAKRVPRSQFVFTGDSYSAELAARMKHRVERALAAAGVNPAGRVVMIPRKVPMDEFHALARVCDVFLDSLEWSGCNSALESMQCGLPLVTLPGAFMRGRHTYAFLRMMGLDHLIAGSEQDYIDLMVRLGEDPAFRAHVREEIRTRLPLLYGDTECVRGLERFIEEAVSRRRRDEEAERGAIAGRAGRDRAEIETARELPDTLRAKIRTALSGRIPKDRPVVLVDFPDSLNCGDLAIWHGEAAFLRELGIRPAYTCSMQTYDPEAMRRALGEDGMILLHGGGNFGDTYIYHRFREQVLRDFPIHDALMFPQTVQFFSESALQESADFYNRRGRITLCARDRHSFEILAEHFGACELLHVPDMAFLLPDQIRMQRPMEDVLWLARTDAESRFERGRQIRAGLASVDEVAKLRVDDYAVVASFAMQRGAGVRVTDWYQIRIEREESAAAYRELAFQDRAALQFAWAKLILSMGRVVITDRLHGHIVCMLIGIPHVLIDNNYGKLRNFVETWTASSPLVRFAESPDEALTIARELCRNEAVAGAPVRSTGALIRDVVGARLSYLSEARLAALAESCRSIETQAVPGIVVETGCALGGAAIVIGKTRSPNRVFRIYDVFGTIPPPSERDGADVHERYREIAAGRATGIGADNYYGYEPDLLYRVRENLARFDLIPGIDYVELVRGLFEDTLRIDEPVAFAHIDCDWYESVRTCLERIVPRLSIGGVLVIDDYSDWSGCRQAADDYFLGKEAQFTFEKLAFGPLRVTRRAVVPDPQNIWANSASLSPSWAHRAREVARFIRSGRRVLDLGCGAMDLEKFLPDGCTYIPCDCVARDTRTLVCDFGADELPVVPGVDLVTVLGVCEYLTDLPGFFSRLRSYRATVIFSYVPYDPGVMSLEQRDRLGWTSHLTQEQWRLALQRAGFRVEVLKPLDRDLSQYLYRAS